MKKVIYTCLTSEYDTLADPAVVNENWDYVCFSNSIDQKNHKVWKIRKIPLQSDNNILLSRYIKLRPDKALTEYDVSLYIDANIQIVSNDLYNHLNRFISNSDFIIAAALHPERQCLYQEALACIKTGKSDYKETIEHLNFLKSNKFPEETGLYENNIILRKHNDPTIKRIGKEWWTIFKQGIKRDQLSLEYVLWKSNERCVPLFNSNFDVRKSHWFIYKKHKFSFKHKLNKNKQKYSNRIHLAIKNEI